jgi:hypothetical protein
MTLRDELAAVLGPGNDDATAYHQADAVIHVLEVNGVIANWTSPNERGDAQTDQATLAFVRSAVRDHLFYLRPAQEVFDEIVEALA